MGNVYKQYCGQLSPVRLALLCYICKQGQSRYQVQAHVECYKRGHNGTSRSCGRSWHVEDLQMTGTTLGCCHVSKLESDRQNHMLEVEFVDTVLLMEEKTLLLISRWNIVLARPDIGLLTHGYYVGCTTSATSAGYLEVSRTPWLF